MKHLWNTFRSKILAAKVHFLDKKKNREFLEREPKDFIVCCKLYLILATMDP